MPFATHITSELVTTSLYSVKLNRNEFVGKSNAVNREEKRVEMSED